MEQEDTETLIQEIVKIGGHIIKIPQYLINLLKETDDTIKTYLQDNERKNE